jgi:DNA methylase
MDKTNQLKTAATSLPNNNDALTKRLSEKWLSSVPRPQRMVNQVAVFASSRWKARDQDGVRCRYNGLSEPCHRRHWCGDRDQGDVWYFDKPAKNDLHPTMKPVALVERAIRNSSNNQRREGDHGK